MPSKPLPQRKSPRLRAYNYAAPGAYFVTICTHQRQHDFGEVVGEEMQLSNLGEIAARCWESIVNFYPMVTLDAFMVMPNHVHGILVLPDDSLKPNPPLGQIIGAYKGAVTKQASRDLQWQNPIWQGRYHDHIFRDEGGLTTIREYVQNNPQRWASDTFYKEGGNVDD